MYTIEQLTIAPRDTRLPEHTPPQIAESLENHRLTVEYYLTTSPAENLHSRTLMSALVDTANQMAAEFYKNPYQPNQPLLEKLGESGPAVLSSEALALMGIRHYLWFANNRTGVLVPTLDPHNPDLTLYVSPNASMRGKSGDKLGPVAIGGSLIKTTAEELTRRADARPHAVKVDTAHLARSKGLNVENLIEKSPWLVAHGHPDTPARKVWRDKTTGRDSRFHVVMNVYEPSQGRDVLVSYGRFCQAVASQDVPAAMQEIARMGTRFPVVDANNAHPEIAELVRICCDRQQPEQAIAAVVAYFENIETVSNHPQLARMKAVLFGTIAEACQSATAGLYKTAALTQSAALPQRRPMSGHTFADEAAPYRRRLTATS